MTVSLYRWMTSKTRPGGSSSPEEVEVTVSFSLPQKDVPVEVIFVDNVEIKLRLSFEPSIVT